MPGVAIRIFRLIWRRKRLKWQEALRKQIWRGMMKSLLRIRQKTGRQTRGRAKRKCQRKRNRKMGIRRIRRIRERGKRLKSSLCSQSGKRKQNPHKAV